MTKSDEFNKMLMTTLGFEGGFTVDHRGPTNYGVSQPTYDAYVKQNKLPSKSVKQLTYGEVKKFYEDEFYKKPGYDKFSPNVATVLFDYGVNAGTSKASKDLQTLVGATPDGIIGKKTLAALDAYIKKNGESKLINDLIDTRSKHYESLIAADPKKYGMYAKGWANRINKLREKFQSSDDVNR